MSKKLYFLSIHVPQGLEKEILHLKEEVRDRFQSGRALRLPAHVTLVRPTWIEQDFEAPLVDQVAAFLKDQPPFEIELEDFGAFTPRTIYIKVIPDPHLGRLKHQLDQVVERAILSKEEWNSETKKFVPHITIANRDLTPEHFQKAWKEFQQRSFKGSFQVREVHLLRHNGKRWEVIQVFPLSVLA